MLIRTLSSSSFSIVSRSLSLKSASPSSIHLGTWEILASILLLRPSSPRFITVLTKSSRRSPESLPISISIPYRSLISLSTISTMASGLSSSSWRISAASSCLNLTRACESVTPSSRDLVNTHRSRSLSVIRVAINPLFLPIACSTSHLRRLGVMSSVP